MNTVNTWVDDAIPAGWIADDPSTWVYSTTVDAHMGYHGRTGLTVRELKEIRTAAVDYADGPNDLRPAAVYSWANNLYRLHNAAVAMAEASPEVLDATARDLELPAGLTVRDWVADADNLDAALVRADWAADLIWGYLYPE